MISNFLSKAILFLLIIFSIPLSNLIGEEEKLDINPVYGPGVMELGDNIAQIKIDDNYIFLDGDDTRTYMNSIGNPPSNAEVGLVVSNSNVDQWMVLFEYDPVGFIKDDEKDEIHADALLKNISGGTEEQNKIRIKNGFKPIKVIGWDEKPHYDSKTHNLTWSILLKEVNPENDDNPEDITSDKTINYNVRLLGRNGYMSVVLISGTEELDAIKPELENLISNFSYKQGKSYSDYVKGDKVASYGLTALIAGGAGAAAVKYGFFKILAKAWKLIAAGVAAFFAIIKNKIKRIFSRE